MACGLQQKADPGVLERPKKNANDLRYAQPVWSFDFPVLGARQYHSPFALEDPLCQSSKIRLDRDFWVCSSLWIELISAHVEYRRCADRSRVEASGSHVDGTGETVDF